MSAILNHSIRRFLQTSARRLEAKPLRGPSAVSGQHGDSYLIWKRISLFVALPAIALCAANVFLGHHHEERPPFVKYEYMRVRTKRFPWGDGNHSLFHNKEMNALPDGYED